MDEKEIRALKSLSWFFVGAMILALIAGCGERAAKTEYQRPPVVENGRVVFPKGSRQIASLSSDVVRPAAAQQLRLTGRLVWDEERTVRLFPAFAGRVERILVRPGDAVKQGQALAVLASPDYGQAQAEARRAQTDFALAEKNLARLRDLHANGVAARKDLQAAEADYQRAGSEFGRALAKVKLYGGRAEDLDQNFTLASPISGIVIERNINPGQELRPDLQLANQPAMFLVTDPTRLWVLLDASELDLSSLKVGRALTLRTSAWPEVTFSARIDAIADFVDPNTRTVKVRGSVANGDRRLKGEMFVSAELQTESRAGFQVPSKAVFLSGEKHYVFIEEEPGRYRRVEVKLNGGNDATAVILSGVSAGQRVVVQGSLFLQRIFNQLTSAGAV